MSDEVHTLTHLLATRWRELTHRGRQLDGFETVARFEGQPGRWTRPIVLVTRTPSGQHFRWAYEQGLATDQDTTGPAECGAPELISVRPVAAVEWQPA